MDEGALSGAHDATGTDSWAVESARPVGPSPVWRPLPEPGDLLGGRFFLRRVLGAGATGIVFAALDHTSRRDVALKLLRPETLSESSVERLRREVSLSQPGHPNVVALHDLHEAGGFLLLSMELVDGASLSARLAEKGPLPVDEVVSVGRQIAAALSHLHAGGLVHRDVKPGNILLTPDGVAKLCDLGLLRPVDHGLTVTATASVVGTPAYMAPEQATGKELTGAADVYALGLTLWQALTGKVPILGSTAVETLTRRQREEAPALRNGRPDCPRWLERLLRRMLAPRPMARPSCSKVEMALVTRRYQMCPSRRSVAVAAGVALFGLALFLAGQTILPRSTVRFERTGNTLSGVDVRGGKTWTYAFESPVQHVQEVDLDGGGRRVFLVSAYPASENGAQADVAPRSEFALFSSDGVLLTRIVPEALVSEWRHAFPKRFTPWAVATDVDGDGLSEVLVVCPHSTFFPTELLVYWPRQRLWEHVLDHWGRIYEVTRVRGRPGRVGFLARANAWGMGMVFGEFELVPPAERSFATPPSPLLSANPGLTSGRSARWAAYTLFEPASSAKLEGKADGGFLVRTQLGERSFDQHGAPLWGANAKEDLRERRLAFASGENVARWSHVAGVDHLQIARLIEPERARYGPLLTEPQYRLAFDLLVARQLALAHAPREAAALLRETSTMTPGEEAQYQRASFLALGGDLAGAAELLRDLTRASRDLRGSFDAPQLLLRVEAERHEQSGVNLAIDALSLGGDNPATQPKLGSALRARVNVLVDQVTSADTEVRSWPWAPDGDATAVLARWRLGRTTAADVKAMEVFVSQSTGAESDGRLALAAAFLGTGRARDAVMTCEELLQRTAVDSRLVFERRQQVQLATALLAVGRLAAGSLDEARATAEGLLSSATPGLLSSNLAREVRSACVQRGTKTP